MATSNSTILGKFLMEGTTDVAQRLGFDGNSVDTANIKNMFLPMNNDIYNTFCQWMINRVGYSYVHQQRFENPFRDLIKNKIYYGNSVDESMLGWIKGHSYELDAEDQFKKQYPDGLQAFHSVKHKLKYPYTITRENMRRAVVDDEGLSKLIAAIEAQPMNADAYDMYIDMLNLFPTMDNEYTLHRVKLSTAPTTKEGCEELLETLQRLAYDITIPSTEYSQTDIPVFAKPDELIAFIRSSTLAATNVKALAAAYNLDKADIQYRLKVIPDKKWPLGDDDYVVLTTTDFFQVYPVEYMTTSQVDPSGLAVNGWLHNWSIVSASPFVPCIVLSTADATTIDTVTLNATALNLSIGSAHVSLGGTVKLTPTLTGTITPKTDALEMRPDSVTWELSATRGTEAATTAVPLNARTYVDNNNVLHVQKTGLKKGDVIHLTATSSYMNPDGTGDPLTASATVTIE